METCRVNRRKVLDTVAKVRKFADEPLAQGGEQGAQVVEDVVSSVLASDGREMASI